MLCKGGNHTMTAGKWVRTAAAAAIVTISVSTAAQAQVGGFPDVPAGHWAATSVAKLAKSGIIKGYAADQKQATGKPAAAPAKAGYNGNKPVTRYELAVTLYRFVTYMERAYKQRPTKMGAQAAPKTGAATVQYLVANGYLPKDSPLGKEGGKVVTANELADAMAQVITRIRARQIPITPESKYDIPHPPHSPGT